MILPGLSDKRIKYVGFSIQQVISPNRRRFSDDVKRDIVQLIVDVWSTEEAG